MGIHRFKNVADVSDAAAWRYPLLDAVGKKKRPDFIFI
jgi:hypothetical protein